MAEITIILPASKIACGNEVRRPTGAKLYTLQDRLEIYGADRQTIQPDGGILFLVRQDGIVAIRDDAELAMDMTLEEAENFIAGLREEEHPTT